MKKMISNTRRAMMRHPHRSTTRRRKTRRQSSRGSVLWKRVFPGWILLARRRREGAFLMASSHAGPIRTAAGEGRGRAASGAPRKCRSYTNQ